MLRRSQQGAVARTPFLVLASTRSGGQMLAYALDTHPLVCCNREEVLGASNPWLQYQAIPQMFGVRQALAKRGYLAAGCKLTSGQFRLCLPDVVQLLDELRPRIIWLQRRNKVRRALSAVLTNQRENRTPEPASIVKAYRQLDEEEVAVKKFIATTTLPVLPIFYEDIIGSEQQAEWLPDALGRDVAAFLNVEYRPFEMLTERWHGASPETYVDNWDALQKALNEELTAGGDKG